MREVMKLYGGSHTETWPVLCRRPHGTIELGPEPHDWVVGPRGLVLPSRMTILLAGECPRVHHGSSPKFHETRDMLRGSPIHGSLADGGPAGFEAGDR